MPRKTTPSDQSSRRARISVDVGELGLEKIGLIQQWIARNRPGNRACTVTEAIQSCVEWFCFDKKLTTLDERNRCRKS